MVIGWLVALHTPLMSASSGSSRQAHSVIATEARLISSQKDKWEECGSSDMSNEILSSSKYRLDVNSDAAKHAASAWSWSLDCTSWQQKLFHFAPDSTAFSSHHSTLNTLWFSMHGSTNSCWSCSGSAPLNSYQIACHFVDGAVTTGGSEKKHSLQLFLTPSSSLVEMPRMRP